MLQFAEEKHFLESQKHLFEKRPRPMLNLTAAFQPHLQLVSIDRQQPIYLAQGENRP